MGILPPVMRSDYLDEPHAQRLAPTHRLRSEILAAHRAAIERGVPTYRDPLSGLAVLTADTLAERGYCCGSGCRHCPYLGAEPTERR